jgi:uncharacterized membrane protein
VSYRFQVTNTSTTTIRLWLVARLDRAGWSVSIAEPTGPISLQPGQARDVIVDVVAPNDALAGEQATLRLTAVDEAGVELDG